MQLIVHCLGARQFGLWVLLAVGLADIRNADSAPVDVGLFSELNLVVDSSGATETVNITSPEIVFDHQLEVWRARTLLLIESRIGSTLSGGNQTRLFFLRNGTKLSLRGVNLAGGVANRNCSECPSHGGAVIVSDGSELGLHSARVFNNRADFGGAIFCVELHRYRRD